jgi:hypothetical protein
MERRRAAAPQKKNGHLAVAVFGLLHPLGFARHRRRGWTEAIRIVMRFLAQYP